jgi:D-methionine transport system ATP-binding protein
MGGSLEIRKLSKRFGGVPVLEDIDLKINAGEIFGIIGRSGAGKSTLVRCINFLERPDSGEVLFDGQPLSGLTQPQLYQTRQSMGMIFQQFNLLMQRNALDNVCFPLEVAGVKRRAAKARARELLELVGLPEKAGSYPSRLSGGQRQRVAIARAIALNPKVLLCDEATSALDPETTRGVLALLRDINRSFGITIVVITHEMQVVEAICGRVAILDECRVAEEGPVSEVFANPKTAAAKRLVYPGGCQAVEEVRDAV